ncbi:MAG: DUF1285 domain-containing protein [Bacillota bacterium]
MHEQELRIDLDGNWFWEGNQLIKMEIVQLFASHLQPVGDGYAVCYNGQCYPVVIEDVPFMIVSFYETEEGLMARLADEREVEFQPGPIMLVNTGVPYFSLFWKKDTKLSRQAFWQLNKYLQESKEGYRLRFGEQCWTFEES